MYGVADACDTTYSTAGSIQLLRSEAATNDYGSTDRAAKRPLASNLDLRLWHNDFLPSVAQWIDGSLTGMEDIQSVGFLRTIDDLARKYCVVYGAGGATQSCLQW